MFRKWLHVCRSRASKGLSFQPHVLSLEDRCVPTAISWSGGGDGYSWTDPNNWNGVVPGVGDDVSIGSNTRVGLAASVAIHSLGDAGRLTVSGSLSLATDSSLASLDLSGTIDQLGGTLNVGVRSLQQGHFIAETGAVVAFMSSNFTISANDTWSGGGTFQIAGSTVTISGNISAPANLAIANGTLTGAGTPTSTGTLRPCEKAWEILRFIRLKRTWLRGPPRSAR